MSVENQKTLEYYNESAKAYADSTVHVDFEELQNEFLSYLPEGASVLDVGTGSGRDARYFKEQGCVVTAMDGSAELAKLASKYLGQEVIVSTFQEYEPDQTFDGIWACASLLHLNREDLVAVMKKLALALHEGGCFYASFKYGDFSGERNGRFFTDLNYGSCKELLEQIPELEMMRSKITKDARQDRSDESWLNVFLRRKAN